MQAKVFHGITSKELQTLLQQWLDTNPNITIMHMAQSQSGHGWFTVTLLYTTAQS